MGASSEKRPSGSVRRRCRQCGAHTYSSRCGSCGSSALEVVPKNDADLRLDEALGQAFQDGQGPADRLG